MKKLENGGLAVRLQKCEFAKNKIEWIGSTITPSGNTPLITKIEATMKHKNPKPTSVVPTERTPPEKIHPETRGTFRTTTTITDENSGLKKLDWKEEQSSAFNKTKNKLHHMVKNKHFDTTK